MTENAYYHSGFQREVSQSHAWRTAVNSLEFILKDIKPTNEILDVGCGPGTITNDLAQYVPQGKVTGLDTKLELISQASNEAERLGLDNVHFEIGTAVSLPFKDNTFDIVYAHQVLLHLSDPVAALIEMKRVTKKNGIVCCRDADLNSMVVFPPQFESHLRYFFLRKSKKTTTSITGGRELKHLALKAGFPKTNIKNTCSTWCISDDEDRRWFSELYADRLSISRDKKEDTFSKENISEAWKSWAKADDGVLILSHGEIVCRK